MIKQKATVNKSNLKHTRSTTLSKKLYASVKLQPDSNDIHWQRISNVLSSLNESYAPDIFLDVSSILSSECNKLFNLTWKIVVAQCYSQLGLIKEKDPEFLAKFTTKTILEWKQLEKDYILGDEIELKPI